MRLVHDGGTATVLGCVGVIFISGFVYGLRNQAGGSGCRLLLLFRRNQPAML